VAQLLEEKSTLGLRIDISWSMGIGQPHAKTPSSKLTVAPISPLRILPQFYVVRVSMQAEIIII
jgi:hypothetical protein